MKNLGTIKNPKDITNKEYVDKVAKELDDKLNEIEALTEEEIDQILVLSEAKTVKTQPKG